MKDKSIYAISCCLGLCQGTILKSLIFSITKQHKCISTAPMFLFSKNKSGINGCLCEKDTINRPVWVLRGLQHTEDGRTDTLLATLLYRWCRAGESGPLGSKPGAWLSTGPSEGAHENGATWRSFPWRTALPTLPSLHLCQETPRTRVRECWTKETKIASYKQIIFKTVQAGQRGETK